MKFQDLELNKKILLAVLSPLSLLFVLVIITVVTVNTMLESARWVEHTNKILGEAAKIASSAVDMETGMRGFLLTGHDSFLEPYQSGNVLTFTLIHKLKEEVSDNPQQVKKLEQIQKTLQRWNDDVAIKNIALRREIGDAASINDLSVMMANGKGKVVFDEFRAQIDTYIQRQVERLRETHTNFTQAINNATANFVAIKSDFDSVTESHEITDQASLLLLSARNMQTGMRGFLLSGEEPFLAPYYAGERNFKELVSKLKVLSADRPLQLKLVEKAEVIFQEWNSSIAKSAIELRRSVNKGLNKLSDVETRVAQNLGKKQFDMFRDDIDAIISEELKILNILQEEVLIAEKRYLIDNQSLVDSKDLVNETNMLMHRAHLLLVSAINMETGLRGFLLTGKEPYLDIYSAGAGSFNAYLNDLRGMTGGEARDMAQLDRIEAIITRWRKTVVEPMIQLRRNIKTAKTMGDLGEEISSEMGKRHFDDSRQMLIEFRDVEEGLLKLRIDERDRDIAKSYLFIGITLLAAVIIGAAFALVIGRGITSPVRALTGVMQRLADGDTGVDIPGGDRKDELGLMAKTVEIFKENLTRIVQLQKATKVVQHELEKQSDELERSNQELENFAYIASHDLKAPLRGISNLSKWISEDLGDSVDDETRENLDLMHSRVERLEGMLDGILEFSRVGRGNHKPEKVDANILVADVVDYLSVPEGCEVHISGELPTLVTEKIPLEQVFRNLIGNAVKHRDADEILIHVSGFEDKETCTFEVRDNGPGISEEFHERVFLMFQTLKPRDEMEASGMGLALVKKLIDYNGGDIFLESNPDKRNTVFRFTWNKSEELK